MIQPTAFWRCFFSPGNVLYNLEILFNSPLWVLNLGKSLYSFCWIVFSPGPAWRLLCVYSILCISLIYEAPPAPLPLYTHRKKPLSAQRFNLKKGCSRKIIIMKIFWVSKFSTVTTVRQSWVHKNTSCNFINKIDSVFLGEEMTFFKISWPCTLQYIHIS